MELNIKLIGNIGRLNKREPFIIADNEKLVLNFSCATPLTDYYIELKNGDKSAKYRLNAVSTYEVPSELSYRRVLWKLRSACCTAEKSSLPTRLSPSSSH